MVEHFKKAVEITFRKAIKSDEDLLKKWFQKPHVQEFWDNSPEMWQNVESYLNGNKVLYDYWIGSLGDEPFCLVITSENDPDAPGLENDPNVPGSENHLLPYLEPQGQTWTIDFMIGEEAFLGKGLSHGALREFMAEQRGVAAFLIDPEATNAKAIHVYEKAGFLVVGRFTPKAGYFAGMEHLMMKLKAN